MNNRTTGSPITAEFIRVQARYRGRLGVEVGIFVAVDHLRRAGMLTREQESLYFDIDDWFHEHLPNPPFYEDGNTVGAVTWFKTPLPREMADRVDALRGILTAHGVDHDLVRSNDPGERIYEDRFQVGVVPHLRREPTPMPADVQLSATTAGSKRRLTRTPDPKAI